MPVTTVGGRVVKLSEGNCGTGHGGFKHGNKCQKGGGRGSEVKVTEKMVDVSDLNKTENEQDEARTDRIAKSYEGDPSDIDWSEQPAIIVDNDMNILDGHHRVAAAEKLGIKRWRALVVNRAEWDRLVKEGGQTKAIRAVAEAAGDSVTFGSAQ